MTKSIANTGSSSAKPAENQCRGQQQKPTRRKSAVRMGRQLHE